MHTLSRLLIALLLILPPPVVLPASDFDELPNLGDASGQVITPKQDKELGAYFMRQVRQAGMVLDDAESTAYLQALGHKLAIYSENPGYGFTFFLVDDASINAFAGPGGYIGANVGLFLAAESESELAGVMAHEIAHVTQRHLARAFQAQERMSLPTTAAILAAILIGATADPSAGAAALTAASAAGIQSQINFTRANEKEADRVGIQTLADAEFDPYGMPQFLRVNNFANPRQVLADTRRYEGKSAGKTPVEQYEFALLLAMNEKHNEALPVMQKLHKNDPDRITYRLALGRILRAAKQEQEALDIYKDTLGLYPGEIMVILPYATTLMATGKSDRAYTLLSEVTSNNDADPQIYKLLAQAAGASNHPVQTHTAMSQYYFLNGYTNQSIEQLKLAEKAPALSSYQTARIQARIANLEALLKAERQE
jgi:predicted Zn-dependent protease